MVFADKMYKCCIASVQKLLASQYMQSIRTNTGDRFKVGFFLFGGIIFLLTAVMFRPFVVVNAGERGVVMQFGKVHRSSLGRRYSLYYANCDISKKTECTSATKQFQC